MKNRLAGIALMLLALIAFSESIVPGSTQKVVSELVAIARSKK